MRTPRRQAQLARRPEVKKQLLKIAAAVERGFGDQIRRGDDTLDMWDIYRCKRNAHQSYAGNASLYVPLVHNAIEARKTRHLNQAFPQAGRYVEVTTNDGERPYATMALMEHYVGRAELKSKVVPALLISGDIEGQYTVCVSWGRRKRVVVSRETHPVNFAGMPMEGLGEEDKYTVEHIEDAGPEVDIIPDPDFLVLPQTSDTIEEALEVGGSVTALCRWTESRVEELIERGELDSDLSAELLTEMSSGAATRDVPKHLADAIGIKAGSKYALIYRIWAKVKIKDEKRLVLFYATVGAEQTILGCRLNPYWCDKPDYLSIPVKKLPGLFKGPSLVGPCADMQYAANDAINEGMDSATYSLLPVIMTDPEKNPRVGSMVMDLMAIWEVSPKDTQPLQFPQLYQHAFNIVQAAERYIQQTLGVNAAMIPQSTGVPGRKRNQAEIALEQQVDVMTASIEVGQLEILLSSVIERFAEYDAQFRDTEIAVRSFGELGVKAEIETVKPLQMGAKWRYRWFGVEQARNAQQIQQQIALINVLAPMAQHPSIQEAGYRMNLVPFVRTVTENAFGPRLAPEIFDKPSDKVMLDPQLENELLSQRLEIPVNPGDDDPRHMQTHMALLQHPDFAVQELVKRHMAAHQAAMKVKQMAQMVSQIGKAMQGGGQQRGGNGPRRGATPALPKPGPQIPGAIHQDQMSRAGAPGMPRKT